jgi:MerR family transcriptional regulator, copper efflux regulator
MHQIGEAASRAGLSFRTVRYYEEVGVVVPSGRTDGGFRLYTDADIERLSLAKQLKPLEFSLEDLRDLLDTRAQIQAGELGEAEAADAAARFAAYVATARQRCDDLRQRLEQVEAVTAALSKEARRAGRRTRAAQHD